jgi:diacylglycerol kinase family enzyme
MKLAVVINVSPGSAALSRATRTQALLLEHVGSQLDSIRLAAPHLLEFACLGAVAEKPDLLVVAGGPKAARRGAQIAHDRNMPIVFLPGMRFPAWAQRLWGSASLEGMITALARETVTPTHLPAGSADGRLFFDCAACGLLPQIAQLREDFAEAEAFADYVKAIGRAAASARIVYGPKLCLRCRPASSRRAAALTISALGDSTDGSVTRLRALACSTWNFSTLPLVDAAVRAISGGDWQRKGKSESFDCTQVTVDAGAQPWLLLDGEPLRFEGPVQFRLLPKAVKTFTVTAEPDSANDNKPPLSRSRFAEQLRQRGRDRWNPPPLSNVRYGG